MSTKITGKDLKATEAIKDYVDKKLERIEKYFDENIDTTVTIKTEKAEQIAEISVKVNSNMFRAVTAHKDLYASIDKDIDILEGQIRKWKTQKDRANKDGSIKQMEAMSKNNSEVEIENEIIKTLYYEIKPMTQEDAKLKLQEKPSNIFLPFINIETNKVNVIYKIKDGKNYGIVEPEA